MTIRLLQMLGVDTAGYNGASPEIATPSIFVSAIFLLAACAIVYWAWRSTRALENKSKRILLPVLRAIALLMLVLALLDPAVILEKRNPIKPRAVVLWDTSRSMTLSSTPGGESRIQAARDWWSKSSALREKLEKNYRTEVWRFDEKSSMMQPEAFTGGPPDNIDGERTDILEALKRVAGSGGEAPAGIILISDGSDNSSLAEIAAKPDGVKNALKDFPTQVFVVPAAEQTDQKDIGIANLEIPEYGFVRNAVDIKLAVASRGFAGTELTITMTDDTKRVVASKSLSIKTDNETKTVELSFTPERAGQFIYKIELPPQQGEAVFENNSRTFSLRVLRDKIRVLHVVGRPSWDVRFLREALRLDPTIELISFYILREQQDNPNAYNEELSLIPFPTDELFNTKIRTFDLIIVQDFPWMPYLYPQYLANIRDFVVDFGGGFVMIGGPQSFTGGHYVGTPVEEILPVELATTPPFFQTGEFKPRPTEAGARHPITALEPTADDNKILWDSLPAVEGYSVTGPAKPEATVLLEHPFAGDGNQPMPVMTVWSAGRGRVMTLATDTSYRWRLDRIVAGMGGEEYLKMWRAAVRWLVGDPETKRVRVRTDKSNYTPTQKISIRVKALDTDYAPAKNARIEAQIVGENSANEIQGFAQDSDESVKEIDNPGPGGWAIKVKAFDENGILLGEDETAIIVEQQGREFIEPWPNAALLAEIAKATGGKVWKTGSRPDADAIRQPEAWRVVGRKRLAVWDNWIAGAFILFVLAAEWYIRRRWGLN